VWLFKPLRTKLSDEVFSTPVRSTCFNGNKNRLVFISWQAINLFIQTALIFFHKNLEEVEAATFFDCFILDRFEASTRWPPGQALLTPCISPVWNPGKILLKNRLSFHPLWQTVMT
jgi:hypothetical protein